MGVGGLSIYIAGSASGFQDCGDLKLLGSCCGRAMFNFSEARVLMKLERLAGRGMYDCRAGSECGGCGIYCWCL